MRVVLDTNCLIMAISARNEYYQVWKDFNISPLLSEYIISAILNRRNVILKAPSYAFHLIEADADDNKFVDCAISSNAKYIVSHDHHFNILKQIPFPKVDVISLNAFLQELQGGESLH